MARELFAIDAYQISVNAFSRGQQDDDSFMWCYSENLNRNGVRYRYEVFTRSTETVGNYLYWLDGTGALDRRIMVVLNVGHVQFDRIYRILSTERPVRLRIDHSGPDLVRAGKLGGPIHFTDAKFFTGLEPVGEGESAIDPFPE